MNKYYAMEDIKIGQKSRIRIWILNQKFHGLRTPDEAFFLETFGVGQTNWADTFWGVFGRFISTNFGAVVCESFVHIFHYSTIISTKKLGKELGI